jgi:hypothetical protein
MRWASSVLAILAAVGLAWWLWPAAAPAPAPLPRARAEAQPTRASAPARQEDAPRHGAPIVAIPESHTVSTAPDDYRSQLRASNDYLAFAQRLLPEAQAGDPAAQFYLSNALGYCESLYEWYFIERTSDGKPRHRTLDEAQQITAARPYFNADDVRDIQARCQGLRTLEGTPFGASHEWFDAALAQRYPLAQAHSALMLALQSGQRGDTQKGRIAREEATRLALESLRSRDTAVLLELSGVGAALAGEGTAEAPIRRWSWLLAASLRDADSVELHEWMRGFCRVDLQCQPYETPADVIRRQAGNDRDEVERRARELAGKLESGELSASDIG